jgi:hypothetical protein
MAKSSKNKLTGQIGEQLVSAMLGTKGYYATPFSGNVPGFDLIATNSKTFKSIPVQVKTSKTDTLIHSRITHWVEVELTEDGKQILGKPAKLDYPDMVWIMVTIRDDDITTARFFIATAHQIQNTMIEEYRNFLAKNDGGRPRSPESLHCALFIKDLEQFENRWEVIKKLSPS